ncbi:MAG: hypothetical protein ACYDFT_04905 [Thermoplasmata archaeon]
MSFIFGLYAATSGVLVIAVPPPEMIPWILVLLVGVPAWGVAIATVLLWLRTAKRRGSASGRPRWSRPAFAQVPHSRKVR